MYGRDRNQEVVVLAVALVPEGVVGGLEVDKGNQSYTGSNVRHIRPHSSNTGLNAAVYMLIRI